MDDCLYAVGGEEQPSGVERYDVNTNTWSLVADMLEGHCYFGAVAIGSSGLTLEHDLFDLLIAKAKRRDF
jgi:hypothetical protein